MNIEDLSDSCKKLPYGLGDFAEPEDQKKNVHDIRRFTTYPAYPWKFDGTGHSKDNPKTFYEIAVSAGIAGHVRKEEEPDSGVPITYTQWVEKHRNEPGWVNYMENTMKG